MNKSQRIKVDINTISEKYIKFNLEQNIDFLEILSLEINQKDIYQNFNADYGVLVGRVTANGGVGIPNVKISVFIPITDIDKNDSDIFSLYPYERPTDKNQDSKRYNLLPRVGRLNPETSTIKPKQPFGSFPTKEEIVTNETILEVYEKYYKYVTKTNNVGDYMLFGVPIGIQTVHMSVDITDIGKYSMTPTSMITNLGYSSNLFTDNNTKIKEQRELNDLPNIETQEISVEIYPFWGDSSNFTIGITRQDFRIRAELMSTFVLFGSTFTMGQDAIWGSPEHNDLNDGFYKISDDPNVNLDARINRIGKITAKIFTYPASIDQTIIDNDISNSGTTINTKTDIIELDPNLYYSYIDSGQFLFEIPCNRRRVITDEFGNEIVISDNSSNGVFSQFLGMIFLEYENLDITKAYDEKWKGRNTPNNARLRFKIPQYNFGLRDYDRSDTTSDNYKQSEIWRKQYYIFEANKLYSVAQFFPTQTTESGIPNYLPVPPTLFTQQIGAFKVQGDVDYLSGSSYAFKAVGNFDYLSGSTYGYDIQNTIPINNGYKYDFPANIQNLQSNEYYFGAQWLNFAMYFPQINWTYSSATGRDMNAADTWFEPYKDGFKGNNGEFFVSPNNYNVEQHLIGNNYNTRFVATRANAMQTTFVEVPRVDIVNLNTLPLRGLNKYDITIGGTNLIGNYLYREPSNLGVSPDYELNAMDYRNGIDYSGATNQAFLFKGMYNTDCIKLIFDLNIL